MHQVQGDPAVRRHSRRAVFGEEVRRGACRRRLGGAALEVCVRGYRFVRRYLERNPQPPLGLRKVDSLIRQTHVRAAKTIYVGLDLNDYSIPPEAVGRQLTLAASRSLMRLRRPSPTRGAGEQNTDRRRLCPGRIGGQPDRATAQTVGPVWSDCITSAPSMNLETAVRGDVKQAEGWAEGI
jgi:hypothetical protein